MKMRTTIRYAVALVLAAGIIFAVMQSREAPRDEAVLGEAAPLFALNDLHGEEIRLADYRGTGVMLNFWATWCTPCVNELPLLNEAHKLTGVPLLAVNVGEKAEKAQIFADRYELAFPVVLDTGMDVKRQYRVVGLPVTVLIDAEGDLIARHDGELTEMADILALMDRLRAD